MSLKLKKFELKSIPLNPNNEPILLSITKRDTGISALPRDVLVKMTAMLESNLAR
jgi:hypothetical protein